MMELHRIGEGQLRITLTGEDMRQYRLNAETMDYDDTATRRAFWEILDEAKKQTGFDAARDRVLIQAFPRRSGGCEMYVTRAGQMQLVEAEKQTQSDGVPPEQAVHKSQPMRVQTVYVFDTPQAMLFCCRMLAEARYRGRSEAWFEALPERIHGRYYLLLWENAETSAYHFLAEFSRKCGGVSMPYIREHAMPIASAEAVEQLAALYHG